MIITYKIRGSDLPPPLCEAKAASFITHVKKKKKKVTKETELCKPKHQTPHSQLPTTSVVEVDCDGWL